MLRDINAAGLAVLIVEEFVHMALENTDRAYVLAKGEVVLEGRSSDLLSDPQLIASYLGEMAEESPAASRRRANGRAPTRSRQPRPRTARS